MSERACQRPGCENLIPSRKRKDARWCSRKCEGRATRTAKRLGIELAGYGKPDSYSPTGDQSLTDAYGKAGPPRGLVQGDDDFVVPADVVPDEFGYTDGALDEPNAGWAMRLELEQQVNVIRARYASEIKRWTAVYARNPGPAPKLTEISRKMRAEIEAVERAFYKAEALELAAADQRSGRAQVRAQERHKALTNMEGFGRDLRGARYEPVQVSRPTHEVFQFPEPGSVFGTDAEVFRKSQVAQRMHNSSPYSSDGWLY